MKAIILAAGLGSRLLPLTASKPKVMTVIFGKTLLDHHIETLLKLNIRSSDITVVTGYKSSAIHTTYNVNIVTNPLYSTTNMVYSLYHSLGNYLDFSTRCLVVYGDILYDEYIPKSLFARTDPFSVVADTSWLPLWQKRFAYPLSDAESFEVVNGHISSIGHKLSQSSTVPAAQYIGMILLSGSMLHHTYDIYTTALHNNDSTVSPSIDFTTFLNYLISQHLHLSPHYISGGWLELDTLDDFNLYKNYRSLSEFSNENLLLNL